MIDACYSISCDMYCVSILEFTLLFRSPVKTFNNIIMVVYIVFPDAYVQNDFKIKRKFSNASAYVHMS